MAPCSLFMIIVIFAATCFTSKAATISPFFSNATHEIYNIYSRIDSSGDSLSCSTDSCVINCIGTISCKSGTFSAASSASLVLTCQYTEACANLYITGPSDEATIYCESEERSDYASKILRTCYYSNFQLTTTTDVNIHCTNHGMFIYIFMSSRQKNTIIHCTLIIFRCMLVHRGPR